METPGSVSARKGASLLSAPATSCATATANADICFAEVLSQFGEEISAMKGIIKDMEAAIKKQPNISRAIKYSLSKMEENLDELHYMTKSWSSRQRLDNAIATSGASNEGGKRTAASPPVQEMVKSAKRAKSNALAHNPVSGISTPPQQVFTQDPTSSKGAQTHAGEWSTVVRRKGNRVKENSSQYDPASSNGPEKKKGKKKRGGSKKYKKPDAILLKPAEGKSYADVLSSVRGKVNPESCGVSVKSMRKTRAGELLVELKKATTEGRNAFQVALKEAAGVTSLVSELVPRTKLEIRELDDYTSVEEVKIALQSILVDYKGVLEIVLTKPNARGQRLAIVSMETTAAKVLLKQGKVKIGWVDCRIKNRIDVSRCFKCLGYGHLGFKCKGPDRAGVCFQCGSTGHKAKDCKSRARCYLCSEKNKNDVDHVAGSGACEVYRKALEEAKHRK